MLAAGVFLFSTDAPLLGCVAFEAVDGQSAQGGKVLCGVAGATFYRWRRKFGGTELQDARPYRQLERENAEFKKMLADSMLKIRVPADVNSKEQ